MRDKKKILFLMPYLGCGGVETTLFSLLNEMDLEKYDVTLALLEKKGAFLDRIPHGINVTEIKIPERERGVFFGKKNQVIGYLHNGRMLEAVKSLNYNRKNSLSEDRANNAVYFERIADTIPMMEGEYDLAVDYFGYATFTTFFLAEKVRAKVKASWLHSIMSRFSPYVFEKWYQKMDVIFACSQMVKEDYIKVVPSVKNIEVFYNIIDPELIKNKSELLDGFEDKFDGVRILTVGRICEEKGQDLAVEAYLRLRREGYPVKWYFIGGGDEYFCKELQHKAETNEEKKKLIFMGKRDNPYPYMRQCDIYVQPSRFEGYCTTTNEARICGCAVVTTDVSGAREQFEDGVTGRIVECNEDAIYMAVKELIDKPEIGEGFKNNLKKMDFDTRKEVRKLFSLIEG